jgi:poly(A) polymerase/tRNA nucleotidyltransferase (CCA-adding enzyme)
MNQQDLKSDIETKAGEVFFDKIDKELIPEYVKNTVIELQNAGFSAYLVGGCVRDLILKRTPKDWDITTNAKPEEIMGVFTDSFYENDFGTVGVKIRNLSVDSTNKRDGLITENEGVDTEIEKDAENIKGTGNDTEVNQTEIIEITPYRTEGEYSDGRHPDHVSFSNDIKDDLQRRDFTMNAIAYDSIKDTVVDLYGGIKDIEDRIIRSVGDPVKRFNEDGLRLIRAIRFAAELGFMINIDTQNAIVSQSETLTKISVERIRGEFDKILMSDQPALGIAMAQKLNLLAIFCPELDSALHVKQNQAHSYDVFEHLLRSCQCAADKGWRLEIRLAALFHDIGKPPTKRGTETSNITFYGHEVVGAKMTKTILERMKYPTKTVEFVTKLIRWHMFFSDTEQITASAVRRMIVNVGKENIWDLLDLRTCDRVGTGRPKENPYRLRKYRSLIEEVMLDPIDVGMLKINGNTLINDLSIKAGPAIGLILNALLEEVLENPGLNTAEYLTKRALELSMLPMKQLQELAEKGINKKKDLEDEQVAEIRKKHSIK